MYLCEKFRNEKFRNMENPFKFGTVVDGAYFTDRKEELKFVKQTISSMNHLILISPRRYGKTSLVYKALKDAKRPTFMLNLQLVTSVEDLAIHLLKQVFNRFKMEKLKHLMTHFRFIPSLSMNPMTNVVDVSFQPSVDASVMIEDVLGLIEKIGEKGKKPIVVLDEFQEVTSLNKHLDKQLRAIMQMQKNVNYIFLGSQEAMMQEIFEKKKSPFYHFGVLMKLTKIPEKAFSNYIETRLSPLTKQGERLADEILYFTDNHPYYTQQLAYQVWEILRRKRETDDTVREAVNELIRVHDYDYERLWATFNKTDRKVLIGLSINPKHTPQTTHYLRAHDRMAPSTAFSAIKRLLQSGYIIRSDGYEIDDPFFAEWIRKRV